MNTNKQLLLLPDAPPLDLASPIFKAKPGWGGKSYLWLKSNFSSILLSAIGITAMLGILLVAGSKLAVAPDTQTPTSQNITDQDKISIAAKRGDSITRLARQALKLYLTSQPNLILLPEQKIYIEDYLKDSRGNEFLAPNDLVLFKVSDIEKAIENSQALKDWQIANLTKYVLAVKEFQHAS